MMNPHLSESAIEALAHERPDLQPREAAEHLAGCPSCQARLEQTRALSAQVSLDLRELLGAGEAFDLDDLVSAAMAAAEVPAQPVRVSAIQSVAAPSRGPLAFGIFAGLCVAAIPTFVDRPELPSVGFALDLVRAARRVFSALDSAVISHLPGGWGLVMTTAWLTMLMLGLSAWPLVRRLLPRAQTVAALSCLGLALFVAPGAKALDLEGELPDKKVTLELVQVPTSEALRRLAQASGLGLVVTLPDDPKVTVRVQKAPIGVVLEAVLGDSPVRVKREGDLLIVRGTSGRELPLPPLPGREPSEAAEPAEPAEPRQPAPNAPALPGVAMPNVPVPPTPGVAPAPPAPPSPPKPPSGRASDRVTFGGNVVIAQGEHVRDVVTMGGNVTVYGVVEGDVVVIGGSTHIKSGAEVYGELLSMGGSVTTEPGAIVHRKSVMDIGKGKSRKIVIKTGSDGDDDEDDDEDDEPPEDGDDAVPSDEDDDDHPAVVAGQGGSDAGGGGGKHHHHEHDDEDEDDSWLSSALSSFSRHALLFVLGLVLLGLVPARLAAVTRTIATAPLRSGALGVVGLVGALILCVLLTVTIIGIPAAIVLGLGLALALYAGVAATAAVIGKRLPLRQVHGSPIRELAAGVVLLFIISLVPVLAQIALAVACMVGLGAIVQTRFAAPPPPVDDMPPAPPPVMPDLPDAPEVI